MKDFTHVAGFTDYMAIVANLIKQRVPNPIQGTERKKILDMPAGNALLADHLRQNGFQVVCADINKERPDYIYTNMEQRLPFADDSFDAVTCLEGIEHVIDPCVLVGELARVLKPGGTLIISMPNLQNFYSRLQFLFSGAFYQFEPEFTRHPRGEALDRGHISSLSYVQLSYLCTDFGLTAKLVAGDRYKKKILLPVYGLLWLVNYCVLSVKISRTSSVELATMYTMLRSTDLMLSRSLVTVWDKVA